MKVNELNEIKVLAQNELDRSLKSFELLAKSCSKKPINALIKKVLSMYLNRANGGSQILWEVMNEVLDFSPLLFLQSFGSFINSVLDCHGFRIEWRDNAVDENGDLIWDEEKGQFRQDVVDKDKFPHAGPVVVWDENGTLDTNLIVEALDEAVQREEFYRRELDVLIKRMNNTAFMESMP